MNKFFKESGFLSVDGELAVSSFKLELQKLLESSFVKEMNESEIRTLGANLSKMIGDIISNTLNSKKEPTKNSVNTFQNMTDDEFYSFLKQKYGERWQLITLTDEEYSRVPVMLAKELDKLFEEQIKLHLPGFPIIKRF